MGAKPCGTAVPFVALLIFLRKKNEGAANLNEYGDAAKREDKPVRGSLEPGKLCQIRYRNNYKDWNEDTVLGERMVEQRHVKPRVTS